jgi:AcrR family transcriptional regulator
MPRRKAEAGLEPNRRAELLRAAARLFVEKGFDATTTRDIADAVGMRSGSPFYHFRSKQELLKTAMVEGLDAGYARLLAAIDGITDPEQRLRVLVRTHLGTLLEGECHAPIRRFLSKNIPSCLSFRPSSVLRQQLHSSTMRLLSRLEADRKSGAIWYVLFRQSPKPRLPLRHSGLVPHW